MRYLEFNSAARIAFIYVILATLWLALSDWLIARLVADPDRTAQFESLNGLVFVIGTAVLLYFERLQADRRKQYLKVIVDSSNAAIIGANLDGTITSWNRGAQELYGYTVEEACRKTLSILIPPERYADHLHVLAQVRAGVPLNNYETVRQRKDGSQVPVSLIVSPITNATGQVTGMSVIAHDITELKLAERAIYMMQVGQLASGLVHEIRNPLNAMRMQIAVIQDSLNEPRDLELARSQLHKLDKEVLRVRELATALLAYGRPAREKPEQIDLPALLTSVVDFIKPEYDRLGLQIDLQIEPVSEDLFVWMDRDKLRQLLMNLTENARQAMHAGGTLTICCDRPASDRIRIQVQDTGCGIPPDKLPFIFDVFYSMREGGTGLGLAIVKNIVEAAGGTVKAQSEVDRGTRVEIGLPPVELVQTDNAFTP